MSTKEFNAVRARSALPVTLAVAAAIWSSGAFAQSSSEMDDMKRQIQDMQRKLDAMSAAQAKAQAAPAAKPATPSNKYEGIQAGPLNIKLGGFIEFAGIYRSRNETSDVGSNFNGVPYPSSSNYYLNEFRETARQSRISILVAGPNDGHQHAEAYYEMDFLGGAQTANSKESNSYNIRQRNIYGSYFNDDSGFSMHFGQSWSLATQYRVGLNPRSELVPSTIDAQYVPGFTWTRNPQLRFIEKFNSAVSVGLSLESPQALFGGRAPTGVIATNTGGGQYNNTNAYSFDSAPDVILKLALDPGWGHYEIFGIERRFKDRSVGSATVAGANHSASGATVGGSVLLPLVPKVLEFQASIMSGKGAGRYGSVQLPDATYDTNGDVLTMKMTSILTGLTWHATPALDLYAYYGQEKVDDEYRAVFSPAGAITGYTGYGIPTLEFSGCSFEGGTCAPNTHKVQQATAGAWWKAYRGPLGYVQLGLQWSNTKQQAFAGLNGVTPDTRLNIGMLSIRYYPYQN